MWDQPNVRGAKGFWKQTPQTKCERTLNFKLNLDKPDKSLESKDITKHRFLPLRCSARPLLHLCVCGSLCLRFVFSKWKACYKSWHQVIHLAIEEFLISVALESRGFVVNTRKTAPTSVNTFLVIELMSSVFLIMLNRTLNPFCKLWFLCSS